jgi:glycosyltransferase involved in cell wall biosynthesis
VTRVVYWNNIPAPYMVDRFNALARRGRLDFEAWFSQRTHADRSWDVDERTWEFSYRYLRARLPLPLLRQRPDLLVSLYGEPEFVAGFLLARARGIRTAFWSEVTFDRWQPRRRWREALKRYLFTRVDGVITAGEDGRAFARRYGTSAERVFLAPHAVDVEFFAREAAAAPRDEARRELGVHGTTFVYVGRLWRGKGLTVLLDAFARVRRDHESTLLLVGDGEDEAELRARAGDGVVFAGFRRQAELPRVYAAADVFVFPTLGDPYGLVVDEAMASGLPLVSTTAAGEIGARVEHGRTGLLVPPDDVDALAGALAALAADPEQRRALGAAAAPHVAGRTPERWAEDFERAVGGILAAPAARPAPVVQAP